MDWGSWFGSAWSFVSTETFTVAGIAAFAGAVGAQVIISLAQTRQAVVAELNSVRAALMLSFSICNVFMGLKRQHLRPLRNRFTQARQEHEQVVQALAAGHQVPALEIQADLQTISPVMVPASLLERYVFEKMTIQGRGLATAVQLVSAIDGLARAIAYRNDLVADFHATAPMTPLMLAERYLGLRTADGVIDDRLPGNVEALFQQADDCIFFAKLLADDLLEHGNKLRRHYSWRIARLPRPRVADWTIAERAGLIPPSAQYADWLRGFRKPPSLRERTGIWFRSRLWYPPPPNRPLD